jgi:plastocyanin
MPHEPVPPVLRLGLRHVFLALIGVGAVAVACLPSVAQQKPETTAGPTAVHIAASEFKFQSDTPTVAAGQPVTMSFENTGTIQHNLDFQATGTHLVADPGQIVTSTVTFPSSGDITYVCSAPGAVACAPGTSSASRRCALSWA